MKCYNPFELLNEVGDDDEELAEDDGVGEGEVETVAGPSSETRPRGGSWREGPSLYEKMVGGVYMSKSFNVGLSTRQRKLTGSKNPGSVQPKKCRPWLVLKALDHGRVRVVSSTTRSGLGRRGIKSGDHRSFVPVGPVPPLGDVPAVQIEFDRVSTRYEYLWGGKDALFFVEETVDVKASLLNECVGRLTADGLRTVTDAVASWGG